MCLRWLLHDGVGAAIYNYCDLGLKSSDGGSAVPVIAAWVPRSSEASDEQGSTTAGEEFAFTIAFAVTPTGTETVSITDTDGGVHLAVPANKPLTLDRKLFYLILEGALGMRSATIADGATTERVDVGIAAPGHSESSQTPSPR